MSKSPRVSVWQRTSSFSARDRAGLPSPNQLGSEEANKKEPPKPGPSQGRKRHAGGASGFFENRFSKCCGRRPRPSKGSLRTAAFSEYSRWNQIHGQNQCARLQPEIERPPANCP